MKLPVDQLSGMILETLRQIRAGVCQAEAAGIATLEVGDDLVIEVELVAPDGLNFIERTATQTNTPKETVETSPSVVEVSTEASVESMTYDDAFETEQVQVDEAEESIVEDERFPVTNTTEEDALQDKTTVDGEDHSEGITSNGENGMDTTTTDQFAEPL